MDELKQKVEKALETYRPFLQQDGGDFEFLGIDDGIVKLRLVGHCGSCPHSTMTLKNGIERNLKEQVPEVKGVQQVF